MCIRDSFIFAHYGKSDIGGLPHIEEAVRQGMLGAFVDGELAGFVGFHPEGSIGPVSYTHLRVLATAFQI